LESQKFYPRREDLEAILRRVDHTGDQRISYEEFSELTSVNEKNLSPEEASDEMNNDKSKQTEELTKDVAQSEQKILRSNSKEYVIRESLEETVDKYESPDKDGNVLKKRGGDNVNRKLNLDGTEIKDKKVNEEENDDGI